MIAFGIYSAAHAFTLCLGDDHHFYFVERDIVAYTGPEGTHFFHGVSAAGRMTPDKTSASIRRHLGVLFGNSFSAMKKGAVWLPRTQLDSFCAKIFLRCGQEYVKERLAYG